jgi:hypothetical protein
MDLFHRGCGKTAPIVYSDIGEFMKMLISLFLLTSALQAHAGVEFREPPVSATTTQGCNLTWGYSAVGTQPQNIEWTGSCLRGQVDGWGYLYEKDASKAYFVHYVNGYQYGMTYLEISGGKATPISNSATVDPSLPGWKVFYNDKGPNAKMYDELMSRYNTLKSKAPKSAMSASGSASKNKNSGSSSNSNSSSNSSRNPTPINSGYGSLTPKPGSYVTETGPYVTCDANVMAAKVNEISGKLEAEGRDNLCASNKAQVKLYYFVITLIEKSCPPSDAEMAETRTQSIEAMNSYIQAVQGSCSY